MDRFWKWLMRTDARSIFFVSLLLFVLVTGWRVWMALQPRTVATPTSVASDPVKLTPFRQLGVMNLISNQFFAQTLVVPVNPFRPTFEAMVQNPTSGDLEAVVAGTPSGEPPQGHKPNFQWPGRTPQRGPRDPNANQAPAGADGPPPIPKYAFRGMFKRPDGRIAAYVKSTVGGGRFLLEGDTLAGCAVLNATADGVMLRMADGTTHVLVQGDEPIELGGQ